MEAQIVETWEIHSRIVLYLLDALDANTLTDASNGKGRTIGDHFAHIHNVRLMWLKASAPELMDGLDKIEKDAANDKSVLRLGLAASGPQIGTLLLQSLASGGKIKGFKPHTVAFMGYLIAHESYHLGKIDFLLRQAEHPVDDKTHYGLWEWGVR